MVGRERFGIACLVLLVGQAFVSASCSSKCCPQRGPRGFVGAEGETGATGPPGPEGPPGQGVSSDPFQSYFVADGGHDDPYLASGLLGLHSPTGTSFDPFKTGQHAMDVIGSAADVVDFNSNVRARAMVTFDPDGIYPGNIAVPTRQVIQITLTGGTILVGDLSLAVDGTLLDGAIDEMRLIIAGVELVSSDPTSSSGQQVASTIDGDIVISQVGGLSAHSVILELNNVGVTGTITTTGAVGVHLELVQQNAFVNGNIGIGATGGSGSLRADRAVLRGATGHLSLTNLDDVSWSSALTLSGSLGSWYLSNVRFGAPNNDFAGITSASIRLDAISLASYVDQVSARGSEVLYPVEPLHVPDIAELNAISWNNAQSEGQMAWPQDLEIPVWRTLSGTWVDCLGFTPGSGSLTNGGVVVVDGGTLDSIQLNTGQILIGVALGTVPAAATPSGTPNQVIVTPGAGSLVFGTPQDIAQTSDVQFGSVKLVDPANQLQIQPGGGVNPAFTVTASAPPSARTLTLADPGNNANFFYAGSSASSTQTISSLVTISNVATFTAQPLFAAAADQAKFQSGTGTTIGYTLHVPAGTPTANVKLTFLDPGGDTSFLYTSGAAQTLSSLITISNVATFTAQPLFAAAADQAKFQSGTGTTIGYTLHVPVGTPTANVKLTFNDPGGDTSFLYTSGTAQTLSSLITISNVATFSAQPLFAAAANQAKFQSGTGTTIGYTLHVPVGTPTANVKLTFNDPGGDTSFLYTSGAAQTLSSPITISNTASFSNVATFSVQPLFAAAANQAKFQSGTGTTIGYTLHVPVGTPTANVKLTFLDPGGDTSFLYTSGAAQTLSSLITVSNVATFSVQPVLTAPSNQLKIVPSGANAFILTASNPAADRTITIPDPGSNANLFYAGSSASSTQTISSLVTISNVATFTAQPLFAAAANQAKFQSGTGTTIGYTLHVPAGTPTANVKLTFLDPGGDTSFLYTSGAAQTLSSLITISNVATFSAQPLFAAASNQAKFQSGTGTTIGYTLHVPAATPAANVKLTFLDPGGDTSFLYTSGAAQTLSSLITISNVATFSAQPLFAAAADQAKYQSGTGTTIGFTFHVAAGTPSANRRLTIPEPGADAQIVLTESAVTVTINGVRDFGSRIKTPFIYQTAYRWAKAYKATGLDANFQTTAAAWVICPALSATLAPNSDASFALSTNSGGLKYTGSPTVTVLVRYQADFAATAASAVLKSTIARNTVLVGGQCNSADFVCAETTTSGEITSCGSYGRDSNSVNQFGIDVEFITTMATNDNLDICLNVATSSATSRIFNAYFSVLVING